MRGNFIYFNRLAFSTSRNDKTVEGTFFTLASFLEYLSRITLSKYLRHLKKSHIVMMDGQEFYSAAHSTSIR